MTVLWTQEEAVAFECACEAITHMMALYSEKISFESQKSSPDNQYIAQLREERSLLMRQRIALKISDQANIAKIRRYCGEIAHLHRLDSVKRAEERASSVEAA